jgi:hypothetical protein
MSQRDRRRRYEVIVEEAPPRAVNVVSAGSIYATVRALEGSDLFASVTMPLSERANVIEIVKHVLGDELSLETR